MDLEGVLEAIAKARIEIDRLSRDFSRYRDAGFSQRQHLMSALSNDIDTLNATLVTLDEQGPGAITAAIAAASSGGTGAEDPAARASLTTLQATVAKTVADLQAAIGTTSTPV